MEKDHEFGSVARTAECITCSTIWRLGDIFGIGTTGWCRVEREVFNGNTVADSCVIIRFENGELTGFSDLLSMVWCAHLWAEDCSFDDFGAFLWRYFCTYRQDLLLKLTQLSANHQPERSSWALVIITVKDGWGCVFSKASRLKRICFAYRLALSEGSMDGFVGEAIRLSHHLLSLKKMYGPMLSAVWMWTIELPTWAVVWYCRNGARIFHISTNRSWWTINLERVKKLRPRCNGSVNSL